EVRRGTGANILTVHHQGRNGNHARGASAIDGAQDTELRLERLGETGRVVQLHMDKQKDAADDDEIFLELHKWPSNGSLVDQDTRRDLSSLYLTMATASAKIFRGDRDWIDNLPENQQRIIGTLADHFNVTGASLSAIKSTLTEKYGDMKRTSFNTAV